MKCFALVIGLFVLGVGGPAVAQQIINGKLHERTNARNLPWLGIDDHSRAAIGGIEIACSPGTDSRAAMLSNSRAAKLSSVGPMLSSARPISHNASVVLRDHHQATVGGIQVLGEVKSLGATVPGKGEVDSEAVLWPDPSIARETANDGGSQRCVGCVSNERSLLMLAWMPGLFVFVLGLSVGWGARRLVRPEALIRDQRSPS